MNLKIMFIRGFAWTLELIKALTNI